MPYSTAPWRSLNRITSYNVCYTKLLRVADDQEWGEIEIAGVNPAGNEMLQNVESGRCIKTFTGSRMPEGADTLIPIENVTVHEGRRWKLR